MVCYKRGVYWSIEQPDSSVMFNHSRLKKLIDKTKAKDVLQDPGAWLAYFPTGFFALLRIDRNQTKPI